MNDTRPLKWEEVRRTPSGMTEAYCILQGYVGGEMFKHRLASDCFCHQGEDNRKKLNFTSDEGVYEFIREAVEEKLARRATYKATVTVDVLALDEEAAKDEAIQALDRVWNWEEQAMTIERQMSL